MFKLYDNFDTFIFRRKRALKNRLSNKLGRMYTLEDIHAKVMGAIMTDKLNRIEIPLIEVLDDNITVNEALSCLPQKDTQPILIRLNNSERSILIQTSACFKGGKFVLNDANSKVWIRKHEAKNAKYEDFYYELKLKNSRPAGSIYHYFLNKSKTLNCVVGMNRTSRIYYDFDTLQDLADLIIRSPETKLEHPRYIQMYELKFGGQRILARY